ncbi:hypothetical protein GDO81_004124 [Engystomops pustulosus]|uniref:Uncharacterized protein n=1 Tax=Engystomops pustulosus TaxID=76066 RepID=A0AAV6ZTY0_ENGPU|nr:hypothetical protein GDO81_004124 [Engystomops pustulosus]
MRHITYNTGKFLHVSLSPVLQVKNGWDLCHKNPISDYLIRRKRIAGVASTITVSRTYSLICIHSHYYSGLLFKPELLITGS